jgi:hypothetical protein
MKRFVEFARASVIPLIVVGQILVVPIAWHLMMMQQ